MNVSNGGLAAQLLEKLYICDLSRYSGTYVLSENGETVRNTGSVMWFAAPDARGLYYSDQRNFDYLTYLSAKTMDETCVLERACANIIMRDDTVLFLDEEDGCVCEFDPAKGKSSYMIKEKVFSFILAADKVYYASENGLKCFDLHSRRTGKLEDCFPVCLNFSDGYLVFSDKYRDFTLCRFDVSQNELVVFDDIRAQSIITTEKYIFASNLADGNSIIRTDITTGESIRFCGESADKLHIIGKHLYFLNQFENNAWYRVPLSGGRPVPVLLVANCPATKR